MKYLSRIVLLLCVTQLVFATDGDVLKRTGLFFNVASQGATLSVTTRVPKHPQPYPQAGIQILTPGYRLANPAGDCASIIGGMCIFSVSNTVPKVFSIAGPKGIADIKLCLDGVGTLTCQHYFHHSRPRVIVNQRLYVVSAGEGLGFKLGAPLTGFVSVCTLLNNGATLGTCVESDNVELRSPQALTFNPGSNVAYISNFDDGNIVGCGISATTGLLTTCTSNPAVVPRSLIGAVGVDSRDTFVYVPDYPNNRVLSCPIVGGGSLGACTDTSGAIPGSIGVTIKDNFAYISQRDQKTVSKCSVIGGTLSLCNTVGSGFSGPLSVSFNASGRTAYVANTNNTISVCPVLANGNFGTCIISGQSFGFGIPPIANIAMESIQSHGYVPNAALNTVSICSIGANNDLGTCTQYSNSQFITPTGVAVSPKS